MRVIECDVCGHPLSGADDAELLAALRGHMREEHAAEADDDVLRRQIEQGAYDAMDS